MMRCKQDSHTRMASQVLAILILALPFSSFAQDAGSSVTADLVIQMQQLQDEVRELRGQLEDAQRELQSLRDRQRDQYLDLDQRITDLRGGRVSDAAPSTGGVPEVDQPAIAQDTPPVSPATAPAVDVPEVRDAMDESAQLSSIGDPQVQSQSTPDTAADEKAAYDTAFQALKELKYADAAQLFQEFLDRYPASEYADNAQYWLGESYYVTRNYDIALGAFEDLLDNYSDSSKVPDALLKIGYTHYELKNWDQARAALTRVEQEYPNTTLARLAANRLNSMRMEGHY